MKGRRPDHRRVRAAALAALFFGLFQKSVSTEEPAEELSARDEAPDCGRIRCPLCRWRPRASDRWVCYGGGTPPEHFSGGCLAEWNTFETRGLCPGCGHQWRWTACLACEGWSPHEDWYAREED
ncbi:MAG TPA: hypothetical protein VEY09_00480 [Pyrinomonadaceae bacterium]|nr:hypothetical protein [Pyrinomonadaceae bacterium]